MIPTIYTTLFGPYDLLKGEWEPNPNWRHIAFTDQDLKSDTWEIVKVDAHNEPRRTARFIKAMFHEFIDAENSIYIDASFIINCNLTRFLDKHIEADFSAPKHPVRNCVYEEAKSVLHYNRGGGSCVALQVDDYRGIVPPNNGLITSGILLRKRTDACIKLCSDWWEETERYSLRDQVSFAKVALDHKDTISTFDYKYPNETDFVYVRHLKR